jgi:hypothetical protein
VVADLRAAVADFPLPEGYFITLGGQFQAQEEAARLISLLALGSVALIFMVLYSRYRSALLAGLIMANVPLALVGSVLGLWLSGQPLSVAALIGFITLAGIATRNGILKISHYLNLMRLEGEAFGVPMIVRGSLERLTPVLMTALVAAFALAPLLFEAEQPGTEILHPVAVVIFSGLISSTLLDTFVTPALFWLFGRQGCRTPAGSKPATMPCDFSSCERNLKMTRKNTLTVAFALLALNLPMAAAHAHAEHGKPQFGGVVAEAGEAQFEIVAKDGKITVHVSNHGAPVDTAGAKRQADGAGRRTAKSEIVLKPAGKNLLQAAGNAPSGAKLLINVQLPGKKALQARAVMP